MKFSNPLRIIRNLLLFFFVSTTVMVVVYRFVPVYVTPLMVIRSVQQFFKGESPAWHHEWVPFDRISPHLPMAVIASEDNRFATHNGFDFIEIVLPPCHCREICIRETADSLHLEAARHQFCTDYTGKSFCGRDKQVSGDEVT